MNTVAETPVVTCFLRHRGEVLLLRRSAEVGSYQGRWGAVAGYAEGDPEAAARWEIEEETGLGEAVTLVRRGEPFTVDDAGLGRRWRVHPYLFDCARREVRLDRESTAADWVSPVEILRRETVPELWTSYARVAPSVESVAGDREHGSAYLSARALEVLRDRAGWLAHGGGSEEEAWSELAALARRLLTLQPAMAALVNRIHRAMSEARGEGSAAAVAMAAHRVLQACFAADDAAAAEAAAMAAGRTVLTLSRSGTLEAALLAARPAPVVVVAESRPGGEGVGLAVRLADAGLAVIQIPDAALGRALTAGVANRRVDLVMVGADAVLPSGAVINKAGTLLAALAARRAGLPLYAVAASDKIVAVGDPGPATGRVDREEEGGSNPVLWEPLFEVTPADLVAGVVSERGVLRPDDVAALGRELSALTEWWRG